MMERGEYLRSKWNEIFDEYVKAQDALDATHEFERVELLKSFAPRLQELLKAIQAADAKTDPCDPFDSRNEGDQE